MSARGGPPVTICANCAGGNRGGGLGIGRHDHLLRAGGNRGLLRVPAGGGEPTPIVKPDNKKGEQAYVWPHILPGGRAVLFTVSPVARSTTGSSPCATCRRERRRRSCAAAPSRCSCAAGTLSTPRRERCARFDSIPPRSPLSGNPVPVLDHVASKGTGAADVSVSSDGAMAYISGVQSVLDLTSFDRQGHEERLNLPPRAYLSLRFSPDGQRIALDIRDQENDIWIWDVSRRTLTKLTSGRSSSRIRSGRRTASASPFPPREWAARISTGRPRTEPGRAERLTTGANTQAPLTFTPDGKSLIFREVDGTSGFAVLNVLPLEGDRTPKPLMRTPVNVVQAALSPDGHWIAYQSTESGQEDVHIRPFPDVESGHWQVSTDGGSRPVWAPSGHELFYLDTRYRLMTRSFQPKPFAIGKPSAVFQSGLPATSGPAEVLRRGAGRTAFSRDQERRGEGRGRAAQSAESDSQLG